MKSTRLKKAAHKPTIHEVDTICRECATANGGKMYGCHTMHEECCELCGEKKVVTTKHDYVWPKDMKIAHIFD